MLGYDVEIFEANGEKTISTSYPNIYILLRQTDRQTDRERERTDSRGEIDRGRLMRGVDQGSTRSAARGCLVQPERAPGTCCDKEITKTGSSAAVHPMTDCIVQKFCTLAERFIA